MSVLILYNKVLIIYKYFHLKGFFEPLSESKYSGLHNLKIGTKS